MTWFNIDVV